MQRELFFDHALLPSGWARDVRITVADGATVAVAQDAPRAGADHVPGIAVPGLPNLHCHTFQRGMAFSNSCQLRARSSASDPK